MEQPGAISPAHPDDRGRRLDSWKEIAAYLGRDVRTVQRWEARDELPVRRLQHSKTGSVFAYTSELDAWRDARERAAASEQPSEVASPPPATGTPRRTWIAWSMLAVAALVAAGLAAWSFGPLDRWWSRTADAAIAALGGSPATEGPVQDI